MGLLKHAILPFLALMHGMVCVVHWTSGPEAVISMFQLPPKEGEDQSLTIWERHALGVIAGMEAVMCLLCIVGVAMEHSHFRGIVAAMEVLCWGLGALDAFKFGFPCGFSSSMALLAFIGLAVHTQESGLFTKDKNKEKAG